MTRDEYQHILNSSGGAWEPLPEETRQTLLRKWRQVFATGLYAATGKWKKDGLEWHVFSFEYARALNGERAAATYAGKTPASVIVCPESIRFAAVWLVAGTLPDFRPTHADVYVWPQDYAWTMAFTHEESMGLGPYFCRREWVVEGEMRPSEGGRRERLRRR